MAPASTPPAPNVAPAAVVVVLGGRHPGPHRRLAHASQTLAGLSPFATVARAATVAAVAASRRLPVAPPPRPTVPPRRYFGDGKFFNGDTWVCECVCVTYTVTHKCTQPVVLSVHGCTWIDHTRRAFIHKGSCKNAHRSIESLAGHCCQAVLGTAQLLHSPPGQPCGTINVVSICTGKGVVCQCQHDLIESHWQPCKNPLHDELRRVCLRISLRQM